MTWDFLSVPCPGSVLEAPVRCSTIYSLALQEYRPLAAMPHVIWLHIACRRAMGHAPGYFTLVCPFDKVGQKLCL